MTPHLQPSRLLPGGVLPLRPERFAREPWVELGWPGLDPARPCLDVLDFDSSGSVTAPRGNDPVGNRFGEAARAIELVATWSTTDRGKVAVLHFDHPHGASGVHALNTSGLSKRLRPFLRPPQGGTGTSDQLPSLEAAEALAAHYPDHDLRFTSFSDFELTDTDPAEVFSRLASFPGKVHAVVLGGRIPPDLLAADNVTITTLKVGDAPGSFAAAIHRSLTATRQAARYSLLYTPRGGRQALQ